MTALRVIGCDPGSLRTMSAWALIVVPVIGQPKWLDHDMIEPKQWMLEAMLNNTEPDLVVVELPTRVHPTRGKTPPLSLMNRLLEMDRIGNSILVLAAQRGIPTMSVSAPEARRHLGLKASASDAEIGAAIRFRVSGAPRKGARGCENHHRDACAAALLGAARRRHEERANASTKRTGESAR